MKWQRKPTPKRLQQIGTGAVIAFVGLYTLVILGFSTWQERSLPAAWLVNLPEALFAFPLALLYWAGVAAWITGRWLERRHRLG